MLLVSDSALDRTCPGAQRSLVPPEDGTFDHAAGVLTAAWTGLAWQATTSLRDRSPPWRYVTVSPPVRLGAVIRSSFARSQWSPLDRQRQRCPGTSTQVTAAASHISPSTRPFAGCPGGVSLRRCSGPWQLTFRPHGDHVTGFSVFCPRTGVDQRCRQHAVLPLGRQHAGNRVPIPRPGVSRRVRSSAWVHSPGPTIRQFSHDELPVGAQTARWLRARLPYRVPNPAPGLQCPW